MAVLKTEITTDPLARGHSERATELGLSRVREGTVAQARI